MKSPEIQNLYIKYASASNTKVTDEQFGTLLMFFPAILVVNSDGVVDDEEMIFVRYLAKFMADANKEESSDKKKIADLTEHYNQDLVFLLEHMETWKDSFLNTLAQYIAGHQDMKEEMIDILYLFADASEGESEEESKMIEFLKKRLALD